MEELFEGMAMGHNLWLHFGVAEYPFATYFDVHQGYGVLTHSHISNIALWLGMLICAIPPKPTVDGRNPASPEKP